MRVVDSDEDVDKDASNTQADVYVSFLYEIHHKCLIKL